MLKLLTIVSGIYVVTQGFQKPGRFGNEDEVSRWQHRHILNMTQNIVKDALYKVRHADVVQSAYKHTYGYELGLTAAGIMEKYRHMITIYRYYSNAKDFKNYTHTVVQILNGYSNIQSDYNQMVHETVLFYRILDFHLRKQSAEAARAKMLARKYKMSEVVMLDLVRKGVDIEGALEDGKKPFTFRRTMQSAGYLNDTSLEADTMAVDAFSSTMRSIIEEIARKQGLRFPKEKSTNEWVKKNGTNTREAEYKKSLRYKKWAEKWDGYDPEIEGVNIPDNIAKMGHEKASDFLMSELKGDFI